MAATPEPNLPSSPNPQRPKLSPIPDSSRQNTNFLLLPQRPNLWPIPDSSRINMNFHLHPESFRQPIPDSWLGSLLPSPSPSSFLDNLVLLGEQGCCTLLVKEKEKEKRSFHTSPIFWGKGACNEVAPLLLRREDGKFRLRGWSARQRQVLDSKAAALILERGLYDIDVNYGSEWCLLPMLDTTWVSWTRLIHMLRLHG